MKCILTGKQLEIGLLQGYNNKIRVKLQKIYIQKTGECLWN